MDKKRQLALWRSIYETAVSSISLYSRLLPLDYVTTKEDRLHIRNSVLLMYKSLRRIKGLRILVVLSRPTIGTIKIMEVMR